MFLDREIQPVECYGCGGVFPRRELGAIAEIPGYRWPRYCRACAESIRAAHSHRCALCGGVYVAPAPGEAAGLCARCHSARHLRELARVRYHLARARARGLPATLTLGQWLATVGYFDGLCAYCLARPFSDLDHFVPLVAGGGTTAANCVPACAHCNGAKHAVDPVAQPLILASATAITRVGAYLAQVGP
jgi:5-methylcytosine-specific restriction endonuclease McrA